MYFNEVTSPLRSIRFIDSIIRPLLMLAQLMKWLLQILPTSNSRRVTLRSIARRKPIRFAPVVLYQDAAPLHLPLLFCCRRRESRNDRKTFCDVDANIIGEGFCTLLIPCNISGDSFVISCNIILSLECVRYILLLP